MKLKIFKVGSHNISIPILFYLNEDLILMYSLHLFLSYIVTLVFGFYRNNHKSNIEDIYSVILDTIFQYITNFFNILQHLRYV